MHAIISCLSPPTAARRAVPRSRSSVRLLFLALDQYIYVLLDLAGRVRRASSGASQHACIVHGSVGRTSRRWRLMSRPVKFSSPVTTSDDGLVKHFCSITVSVSGDASEFPIHGRRGRDSDDADGSPPLHLRVTILQRCPKVLQFFILRVCLIWWLVRRQPS